jgi:hypothetical protein
METRRTFVKKIFMAMGVLAFGQDAFAKKTIKSTMKEDIKSTVYPCCKSRGCCPGEIGFAFHRGSTLDFCNVSVNFP